MSIAIAYNITLILILTLLSGFADAQGFVHGSKAWLNGAPVFKELAKSLLWFGLGIVSFLGAVRFMREVGIVLPEIQTMIWFLTVIVGVALLAGHFSQWERDIQIVTIAVIAGAAWILYRTGT